MISLKSLLLEALGEEIQLAPVEKSQIMHFVQKHYLKKLPTSIKKIYGVFRYSKESGNYEMIGMAIYGNAWQQKTFHEFGIDNDQILDLKRLYIEDVGLKNIESFVIAKSLKMLKADFPNLRIVTTYSWEGAGHVGSIYQATNATYVGKSGKDMHKYFYVIRGNPNDFKAKFNKPYPKKIK